MATVAGIAVAAVAFLLLLLVGGLLFWRSYKNEREAVEGAAIAGEEGEDAVQQVKTDKQGPTGSVAASHCTEYSLEEVLTATSNWASDSQLRTTPIHPFPLAQVRDHRSALPSLMSPPSRISSRVSLPSRPSRPSPPLASAPHSHRSLDPSAHSLTSLAQTHRSQRFVTSSVPSLTHPRLTHPFCTLPRRTLTSSLENSRPARFDPVALVTRCGPSMFVTRPSSSLPLFAHPPPLFLPSSPPYPAMRQLLRTNLRVPAARNGAADPAGADDRGPTRGGSAAADGHGGCSHYDSADAFLEVRTMGGGEGRCGGVEREVSCRVLQPHVLLPNLPFFSPPVPPFPPSHFAFSLVFPPVPHSAACLVPSLSAHLSPSFSTHNLISASAIFSYSPPSLPPPSVCAVSPDSHPCCSHLPPRLVFITSPLTRPL
ncbi:unnamed protein product [Closterium sp. Naga37s-1]|nr:unnamed protein product [Closterium sp. Naga37s-1]